MKLKVIIAYILTYLGLGLPSYAFSAYQYTYTSNPFQYVENTFTSGADFNITNDSFLKIIVTSENPLETFNLEPLVKTTWDFSVEGFNNRAQPRGVYGDTQIGYDLIIERIGNDGLPNSFYINYVENYAKGPGPLDRDGIGYYADEEFAQFAFFSNRGENFSRVFGVAGGGSWTLEQVSSPVPEVETYAMMMAGLGLIGFVKRRKR
jgi:hypothetical protein